MSDNFPFEHFINIGKKTNQNDVLGHKAHESTDIKQDLFITSAGNKNNTLQDSGQDSEFSSSELKSVTDELLSIIEMNVTPQKYNAFFRNTFTVSKIFAQKIEFAVTTNFVKKMIETHYFSFLKQSVSELFGSDYEIQIHIMGSAQYDEVSPLNIQNDELNNGSFRKGKASAKGTSFKIDTLKPTKENIMDEVNSQVIQHMKNSFGQKIDKSKIFDNFIVGPSNNMAHAFAQSVAKDPGHVYPQLYLYGNSGLGKTHLLHAICNQVADLRPELKICVTTANAFMSEMIMAIQEKRDGMFRRKYTEVIDLLIIDDIHELKNKPRTQTEFFHIFNELQSKGKQLIFTSDKPPKEITGIEERIKTRLSSALLVEIQQPDLETRIAILKKKAIERDIYLSDEVVNLVANYVKSNIRELEGKLITLGAYSDLMNVDIDLEIAKEQLGISEDSDEKMLTMDTIAKAVAASFKIAIGDLKGKSRVKEVTHARHIAMYMTHKILKKTLEEIGDYYSKRDHTSVIHGVKKIERSVKEDQQIAQKIYEIESTL